MVTRVLGAAHRQLLRGLLGVKCTTHHWLECKGYPLAVHRQSNLTSPVSTSAILPTLQLVPHFWAMSLLANPSWNVHLLDLLFFRARGSPGKIPVCGISDSTVATYRQMRGFPTAYIIQSASRSEAFDCTNAWRRADAAASSSMVRQAATHQRPDMTGHAASATQQQSLKTSSTCCYGVPSLMTYTTPIAASYSSRTDLGRLQCCLLNMGVQHSFSINQVCFPPWVYVWAHVLPA